MNNEVRKVCPMWEEGKRTVTKLTDKQWQELFCCCFMDKYAELLEKAKDEYYDEDGRMIPEIKKYVDDMNTLRLYEQEFVREATRLMLRDQYNYIGH